MNAIKKVIIIIICLILIIVIALFGIKLIKPKDKIIENEESVNEDGKFILSEELSTINNLETYSMVKDILNDYVTINSDDENNKLMNILSEQYILEKDINENNISTKIEKIQQYPLAVINTVKQKDLSENVTSFYVNYDLVNDSVNISAEDLRFESEYTGEGVTEKQDNSIIINVDYSNETYSVMPNYGKNNNINKINSIEENEDNKISLKTLTKQQEAELYIQDFNNKILYKLEESYNILNSKYKETRFSNYAIYDSYIQENNKYLKEIALQKYKIDEYDDYTEYTCIDQYGNYYIFDEKGVMDYTVKLDTYTVETEEFKENYSKYSNEQKAKTNIEKVAQAINRHDYEYLYSKLQNNIRTMNFPTINDFETYMQSNFYSINKFEYGDYDIQGDKGIFELKITDATEENENTIEKNFIITIEDGTDFAFSFNL